MYSILVDTGFWIALVDQTDQNHQACLDCASVLEDFVILVPWPTIYETMRTRMVRKRAELARFEAILKRPNVEYVDDTTMRLTAMELTFESSQRGRPLSMVDCLLRMMLENTNIRISHLATFNRRDFADVCHKNRVEFL